MLLIADEVQSGLGRAGAMTASSLEGVRPDLLLLGKALGGGVYPVSAVLGDDEVMLTIHPGEHGSTFGGNPLACRVAAAALRVLVDEELCRNAAALEGVFRSELEAIRADHPGVVAAVRGRGLFFALDVLERPADGGGDGRAWGLAMGLRAAGLLAKPTHRTTLRFAPPLCISEAQLREAAAIVRGVVAAADDGDGGASA